MPQNLRQPWLDTAEDAPAGPLAAPAVSVGARGGLRWGPRWAVAAAAEGRDTLRLWLLRKGARQHSSCHQHSGEATPSLLRAADPGLCSGCTILLRARHELWGCVCQSHRLPPGVAAEE